MEVWKDIEGYEGYYQVSDLGRIRSLDRFVGHNRGGKKLLKGSVMNPHISKAGYSLVSLRDCGKKTIPVHRLVALAFIPNTDNKPNINHKNGLKADNRAENLEWVTQKENIDHAWKTGLNKNFGENHGKSRFTEIQILEIRENKYNLTQRELGNIYGACQGVISKIMRRTRWKHI